MIDRIGLGKTHNFRQEIPKKEEKLPDLQAVFEKLGDVQPVYKSLAEQAKRKFPKRKFKDLTEEPPLGKTIKAPPNYIPAKGNVSPKAKH